MKTSLAMIAVFAIACSTGNKQENQGGDTATSINDRPTTFFDSIYSIQVASITLSLQQWDSTFNLRQSLGAPVKETTKQLDEHSDTHAGSFIKDIEYPGVKLKLFSPTQNGSAFWIMEMILTDTTYSTTRGVKLGDAFRKVRDAYPSIKPFPGVNNNVYYVSDNGVEKSIEMEFGNDRLTKLRMYFMIP